jgi:cyclic pyranopterin phosphate synthase
MPAEGVSLKPKTEILTFEEIVRLVDLFAGLGIDKVRLTGGEPLVRKDVELLTAALSVVPGIRQLAMTTNGLLLESKVAQLREAGLTQLNISLDSLKPDRFERITRRKGLGLVLRSIDAAFDAGFERLRLNCVVLKGFNDDELGDFIEMGRHRPIDVRFIEFMPFQGNGWSIGELMPYSEMLAAVESSFELTRRPTEANEVAKEYRIPGHLGSIGFITSMTENFCGGCNRLRITADGNLKVCLFGHGEVSLRDAIRLGRSDHEIEQLIRAAVLRKKASHDGMYAIAAEPGRPMILIGG